MVPCDQELFVFIFKKLNHQLSLIFCEGKVLQGFKIYLEGFMSQSKVYVWLVQKQLFYKAFSSTDYQILLNRLLNSSSLGGSRQNVSSKLSDFGCLVPANEISEKETHIGGALHNWYSFLPTQYCFHVRKTSLKNRVNLSGKKNFLDMQ